MSIDTRQEKRFHRKPFLQAPLCYINLFLKLMRVFVIGHTPFRQLHVGKLMCSFLADLVDLSIKVSNQSIQNLLSEIACYKRLTALGLLGGW